MGMYFDSTEGATTLQLCSRGLQDSTGASAEFELSQHVLFCIILKKLTKKDWALENVLKAVSS